MNKVTNYIVSSTNVDFKERYILPEFRGRMNELLEKSDELGYEPLLVIGIDGLWWNDEIDFVLDRMSDGCYEGELREWADGIINDNPLKEGETDSITFEGNVYTLTADTTDLSDDGVLTNDCEPVTEDWK